ncbi:PREDICTED: putative disease resistance protein At4g11170 [Prunus mume]|uniref:Disease resistance protein At4g11170 n=1 Tax=Prunus mume TaxID=102107 RepID=A0ABM1LTH7_PRUMU|nr:PREDICTED: putative disease resistance protein At4g11170 [Prunus mume]
MDKVLMWRNALKEAANMSGFDNSKRTGTEADFIEKVAEDVLTKLNRTSSSSDSVELDAFRLRQIEEIESLLCIDSPGVCTVGIWGKNSLRSLDDELFHRLSCQFEATCFLANVKE